jgi:hypothetical protein
MFSTVYVSVRTGLVNFTVRLVGYAECGIPLLLLYSYGNRTMWDAKHISDLTGLHLAASCYVLHSDKKKVSCIILLWSPFVFELRGLQAILYI